MTTVTRTADVQPSVQHAITLQNRTPRQEHLLQLRNVIRVSRAGEDTQKPAGATA